MLFWSKKYQYDIERIIECDPAAKSAFQVYFLYPGFKAVKRHRTAHRLFVKGHELRAALHAHRTRKKTGIEIHPAAKIGKGLFIDHGAGVVIGETAEIGDNCTIYQGVTLGGTGKQTGKRHPTIGNNVMIGAGAKVLGPFTVGDNAKIAAGAVVLNEIPPDSTAVGVPARVVTRNGEKSRDRGRIKNDLDQVHMPDPVSSELCRLRAEIEKLKKTIEDKEV